MEDINVLSKFSFNKCNLLSLYYFNKMTEHIINTTVSDKYECKIDYDCSHNFGDYASGYRCTITHKENNKSLYIYFGVIFSYKKEPYGIFSEVDKLNNRTYFDNVWDNIEESKFYDISRKEPNFVKLFLADTINKEFNNRVSVEEQIKILRNFFEACCNGFMKSIE